MQAFREMKAGHSNPLICNWLSTSIIDWNKCEMDESVLYHMLSGSASSRATAEKGVPLHRFS